MAMGIVQCKDYHDTVKAVHLDYVGHVTYVDWTKNIVYLNCSEGELLRKEQKTPEPAPQLEMGVYELPTGEVYLVKPNREGTHFYAKKLVEAPSNRLTETDQKIKFDFVYESGAIFKIEPKDRMSLARGRELMIRYGRCIVCGRTLKVAESVEQGMGPVCRKAFGGQ